MKTLIAVVLLAASAAAHADGHFSAADVPGAGIRRPGRIMIRNDGHAITAYRFFGDIREAIFSLRSTRSLAYRPFGAAVFDSTASTSNVPAHLTAILGDAARTHGVDPRLLAAVAGRESGWNAQSVSRTGACGIMQLMPATARYLGVANLFDVRDNIFGGAHYLRTLLEVFHGDLDLTLAAYNAGPGAVQRYGGVPPYPETQAYVRAVRAAYERSLR
jgi:soluble lytic murein transglycosylase-like protein